jgi:hypothetical protein
VNHYRVWCPDQGESEFDNSAYDLASSSFEDAAEQAAEQDFDYGDPFSDRTYHVREV